MPAMINKNKTSVYEKRKARQERMANLDTVIVPAREQNFEKIFIGENQWHSIRIEAAMKKRIKYLAVYQVAPISAVAHLAEVKEIRPYQDSKKYVLIFKEPANEITPIKMKEGNGLNVLFIRTESSY